MEKKRDINGSVKPDEISLVKNEKDLDEEQLTDGETDDKKGENECWVCFNFE